MPRLLATRLKTAVSTRALVAAGFLLAVFCWVSGLAPSALQLSGSKASAAGGSQPPPARTLSLAERVRYQRAVEEVYWRHTLWPEQNAGMKPTLDEVASLEATRARVEDSLRKSDALAQTWKRPMTAAQLQSEVERMARETRRPEVLRELWQALDNDPLIVAEVLARPVLVERLVRNYYASDDNFHGSLRAKVEAQLREHTTLDALRRRGAGGKFSQIEAVRVARKSPRIVGGGDAALAAASKGTVLELDAAEWEAETARLMRMFGVESCETCGGDGGDVSLPVGSVSSLQEDESSFYVTSVVASAGKRLQIARVEWAKTNFDSWWESARAGFKPDDSTEGFHYKLAEINQTAAAAADTWTPTKALPEATGTAVWTGTEMIVWGGGKQNSGARYNPATDTWTPTSATNVPSHRGGHTAVWTGTEMIVWGGCERHFDFCGTNDGGRYNPVSDTWAGMSITNAPSARSRHVAVWTGSKMIVWAGVRHEYRNQPHAISSGGVYDLATDSWTTMNTTNAPPNGGSGFTVIWTGSEMIAWGGNTSVGGRYNPDTNTWTPTNPANAPSPRTGHTAVWTGTEMIVWGGTSGAGSLNTGGRYNPATDTWTPTSTAGAPSPRYLHTAVWTGTEMIVWGGNDPLPINTGGRYNPSTDSWTPTNTANAPPPKSGHVAVWTGELMIVWSVSDNKTGGRYNPANDSWTPTDNNDSPPPMLFGVWSGAEMIIWVPTGYCGSSGCPTLSKRYDPATYSWRPMSNTNAPGTPPADRPIAAVWTGTEMIVWGVNIWSSGPGEGGRYNPQTDSWQPVTTNGAPIGRSFFTGIWTGTEMIVWGGQGNDGAIQNTGGRYNPATDTWRPTSSVGAPAARYIHSAIWADTEMIVWGGFSGIGHENTGGRYNPSTDSWTPTNTTGAPEARRFHTAVWTGAEMIVWGGRIGDYNDSEGLFNTGGRYNPSTDAWTPTATAGAPTPRFKHSAVWTGELMIVWGGVAKPAVGFTGSTNTGGRYQPQADAWTPTSTLRAPGRRHEHLAFWTGTGMLVWGGYAEDGSATHGGYYSAHGDAPTNTPPTVRITSPSDNATFESGATVQITTETSDADGEVASVNFYANDAHIGSDSTAPFNFSWSEVPGGSYILKAVATDDEGGMTTSAPVRVSINLNTYTINGRVTNGNGAGLAGITVALNATSSGATTTAMTDAFGNYSFANVAAGGNYSLTPSLSGSNFTPGSRSYANLAGNQTSDFRATPVSQSVTLQAEDFDDAWEGVAYHDTTEINLGGLYRTSGVDITNCPGGTCAFMVGWNKAGEWLHYTVSIAETGNYTLGVRVANTAPGATFHVEVDGTDATGALVMPNTGDPYAWTTVTKTGIKLTAGQHSIKLFMDTESGQGWAGNFDSLSFTLEQPPPPVGVRHNVALASNGGTASASSQYNGSFPAAAAINGDRSQLYLPDGRYNIWHSAAGAAKPDALQVAFDGAKLIDEVVVVTQQDDYANAVNPVEATTFTRFGLTDFKVQYWDGATWMTVPGGDVTGNDRVLRKFSFPAVTTTRIRVLVHAAADGFSRVWELEAWGTAATVTPPPPGRVNVAAESSGATATASSQYNGSFPVAAAINGDRYGLYLSDGRYNMWHGATTAKPEWLQVEFNGQKTITEIDVVTMQDNYQNPVEPTEATSFQNHGLRDFKVQYWDGATWATVPGGDVTGNDRVWRRFTFPAITTGRVRLLIHATADGFSRVMELEAY